jgi:hypothetical protein
MLVGRKVYKLLPYFVVGVVMFGVLSLFSWCLLGYWEPILLIFNVALSVVFCLRESREEQDY